MARKKRITKAKIKKLSKQLENVLAKETDNTESLSRMMDKIIMVMTQEINNKTVESEFEGTPLSGCIASSGAEASDMKQNSFVRTKGQSEMSDSQKGAGID